MNLFSIGPLEIVLIFIVGVLVVGPQRMVQYSQRISKWVKNARKFIQQYSIVLKDIPNEFQKYDVILGEPFFINQRKTMKFIKKGFKLVLKNPKFLFSKKI